MRSGLRFPRNCRVTKASEIEQIVTRGKRIRTRHLDVRVLASPLRHARVGFIVPKHGRSSVERNRLKRRLREIVRTEVLETLPAVDVVIRVRRTAYDLQFSTLRNELTHGVSETQRLFPA